MELFAGLLYNSLVDRYSTVFLPQRELINDMELLINSLGLQQTNFGQIPLKEYLVRESFLNFPYGRHQGSHHNNDEKAW